jgi:hypothetical protein
MGLNDKCPIHGSAHPDVLCPGGSMKAKDTVMPLEYTVFDGLNCRGISDEDILLPIRTQAEISFKAGMKEVVEWTEENIHPSFHPGKECDEFMVLWAEKLKEWGL